MAMDAIMDGVGFVSAGLSGDIVERTLAEDGPPHLAHRHVAGIYADETSLLDDYVRFVEGALAAGSVFILLADASRRHRLDERLQGRGVAIDRLAREGRYLFADFTSPLLQSIVHGGLDEARFGEAAAALFDHMTGTAGGRRPRIALCGEVGPSLLKRGDANAAICIERLWNALSKTWAVDSLCAYGGDVLRRNDNSREAFQRICNEHSAVHFRRNGHG
jgi:hypothetical protein